VGGVYPSSDSPVRVSWPKIILSSRSSSRFAPSTRLRRAARLPETLPRSAPVSLVISEDVGAAFSCVADTCFWRTCPSKRVTRRWQPSGADKEWRFGGLLTLGLRAVALSQGRLAVLDLVSQVRLMDAPGRARSSVAYFQGAFKKLMSEWGMSDGCFRQLPQIIPGLPEMSRVDHLFHIAQAERDVRRLGLHRVEDALNAGISQDDLREYVKFLIAESKARQDRVQNEVDGLVLSGLRLVIQTDLNQRMAETNRELKRLTAELLSKMKKV